TLFIDGEWCAARDGATRTITCPADGSPVGEVSEAGRADAERAIVAARRAFDERRWQATAPERGSFLLDVARELRARKDEFARAEALDTGKRLVEAEIDVDDIADCFDWFGRIAGAEAGRLVDAGSTDVMSRVQYEPIGVCGLITPWNYPLLQAAWK